MKKIVSRLGLCAAILAALVLNLPARAATDPAAVLSIMEHAADWQLAQPAEAGPHGWVPAVGDTGFMALAGISGNPKYRDAMRAMGETNGWGLLSTKNRPYHADDHCIGQTYTELYLIYRDPRMIAPLRERFDFILDHPSTNLSLAYTQPHGVAQQHWAWCDALFMAPPAWLRLYTATGDERYLNFALTNFWQTTDYLYDPSEHLYFRDSTYFKKTEANGQKVFWSRGNGWVLGGLARMLQYLPANHPDRPRIEQIFRDMSAKLLTLQQADGSWRSSLLDPASYPSVETSGTGLFAYGLAWGVNQGLLDRAKFEPAVLKAWAALTNCVETDGKLTHVQPVGADPKHFSPESTDKYGVGAFLLAGSEVYRLAVLEKAQPAKPKWWWPFGSASKAAKPFKVTVTNPAGFWRENETVAVKLAGRLAVLDNRSARVVDSQMYAADGGSTPDTLLFQVDLAPGETRTFDVIAADALAATPPPVVKTFARYVPERYDDFTWESDRIAHRIYGQALIKAEGTVSSGPDVWIKKYRELVADKMYKSKHYHSDNGEEMDDYRVGKSRGCGGLGIWDGGKLYVSSNWRNWKLITTGPIRSEFELTYVTWDAGSGRKVSEVRRISIDAGSWFSKMHTVLTSEDGQPLTIGVGLAERACGTDGTELIAQDQSEGWLSYWQPEDRPKGTTAVAILLPKDSITAFTNDAPDMPDAKIHANVPQPTVEGAPALRDLLAITQVQSGQPFDYYFGASWDRSGDFTDHLQWEAYVKRLAERRDQPVQVTVAN